MVKKLLKSGRIKETRTPFYNINPLTVARNSNKIEICLGFVRHAVLHAIIDAGFGTPSRPPSLGLIRKKQNSLKAMWLYYKFLATTKITYMAGNNI